jgi:hypothetical protein
MTMLDSPYGIFALVVSSVPYVLTMSMIVQLQAQAGRGQRLHFVSYQES